MSWALRGTTTSADRILTGGCCSSWRASWLGRRRSRSRSRPCRGGRCDSNGLAIAAEEAKIKLSSQDSLEVHCLADDGEARSLPVTRQEFESASADLFDRSMEPVRKVLADQMMSAENVDDVVLVGGASRTPKLRVLLQEFMGPTKRLHTEIDPDITVAYGAANILD
mmetsp:Transcript_72313/g.224541  ORF Transcript_72313/g.224541 Transcript_72313/m.224541 type:complete len:167 (+) Transcript_72313:796-1296(+)